MQTSQSNTNDRICGISIDQIENCKDYESLINDMTCPMCLNVVCKPTECKQCQALICENCAFILSIAEQTCITPNCKGKLSKANKFVREVLCALKVTCKFCAKKGMNYTNYIKHIEECEAYLSNPIVKIIKDIQEMDKKIVQLTNEKATKTQQNSQYVLPTLSPDEVKKNLITSSLPIASKMELYSACVEGKLSEFQTLINVKNYPILEEISAKNYGWTAFHYAMHYGRLDVIKFIMGALNQKNILQYAMTLKSNDGRCPLLCLLRSNCLTNEKKKEILQTILLTYKISLTHEVKQELDNRQCGNFKQYFKN